ncbi:MAG: lamin tail domain-containing protein [Bacteroidia bacterium]|nr:lamin tail domain-containing protein [Bacteroidia bacterium]
MRVWIVCLMFFSRVVSAQIWDDFTDGDLNFSPTWQGMLTEFKDSNSMLISHSTLPNSSFYISLLSKTYEEMSWRFKGRLAFNTSSTNYVDFFLYADSSNLLNARNGLLMRLGGVNDELALYQIINGIEVKLIDGIDNVFNRSNNEFIIEIDANMDSIYVRHLELSGVIVGNYVAPLIVNASDVFMGIKIKQSTASFFKKHFLDYIYTGPLIRDTMPPVVDSIKFINNHIIEINFSEALRLRDTLSWHINLIGNDTCTFDSFSIKYNFKSILFYFPCLNENQWHEIYIDSIADLEGNYLESERHYFFSLIGYLPQYQELIINEIMFDPEPSQGLPIQEYIEIYNRSKRYLDCSNLLFCDASSCKPVGKAVLFPDSFLVLYNPPSLNNSGDVLILKDQNGNIIHSITYSIDWIMDELKQQGGYSLELIDPYNLCVGNANWNASISSIGGTPGSVNSIRKTLPIDTIAPKITRFELISPNKLNLFFSEGFDSIFQDTWSIRVNGQTKIARFMKQDHRLGEIVLSLDFDMHPDSFYHFELPGTRDCDSNRVGKYDLHAQVSISPFPGDIVFNEVLFNPNTGGKDFIEIYNRSNHFINLDRTYIADLINGTINKILKISETYIIMPPKSYLLLTEDTSVVCADYTCGKKSSLKVQMSSMPSMTDDGAALMLLNQYSETIDSLVCSKDWHFNLIEDQNGVSLERINPETKQMSKENWTSASSKSGFATPGYLNSQFLMQNTQQSFFSISSQSVSPNNDGFEDYIQFNYQMPHPNYFCHIKIFDADGRLSAEPYNNESIGTEGVLSWDGLDMNGSQLKEGAYLIVIQCHSPELKTIVQYFTLYLIHRT